MLASGCLPGAVPFPVCRVLPLPGGGEVPPVLPFCSGSFSKGQRQLCPLHPTAGSGAGVCPGPGRAATAPAAVLYQ